MAVDTADKRGSVLGLAQPWTAVLPGSDGAALSVGDRQQVAYTYRGISLAAVVTPPITDFILDFDWSRELALEFDHARNATLDFDWRRDFTIDL